NNRAPTLTVDPSGLTKSIAEGATLTFTVTAADQDTDDTVTVGHGALPTGATVMTSNLVQSFSWTPASGQGGASYPVTFTANDGHTTSMVTITITVTQNRAPVIAPIAPKTVAEGGTLQFTVRASDPDGDALVYTAPALPPGATFDGATHQFRWTPDCLAADQTGGHTSARFAVSDGKVTSEATVDITVTGT